MKGNAKNSISYNYLTTAKVLLEGKVMQYKIVYLQAKKVKVIISFWHHHHDQQQQTSQCNKPTTLSSTSGLLPKSAFRLREWTQSLIYSFETELLPLFALQHNCKYKMLQCVCYHFIIKYLHVDEKVSHLSTLSHIDNPTLSISID